MLATRSQDSLGEDASAEKTTTASGASTPTEDLEGPYGLAEQALGGHPDVATVAVISRPDPSGGQLPVAYLTLNGNATVTPETLIAHCRVVLPNTQAAPVFVCVVRALPRTSLGKIDRTELQRADAARVITQHLRAAGVSANVLPDAEAPGAVRLVIDNIPRGRRPTVVRVMRRFAIAWRHAGEPLVEQVTNESPLSD